MYINQFHALNSVRFAFEDLNPIPASYSSASLVIISSLLLWSVIYKSCRTGRILQVLLGLIGLSLGLLGMQLAMTKGAFLTLIPLIVYLGWCFWKSFRGLGVAAVLAAISSACVLLFGEMRRVEFWDAGSIGDRIELIRQGLGIWSNHWFLGVGFHAQRILEANSLTISNYWYPHNFLIESLLIGGVVLIALSISFVVSVAMTSSFCIAAVDSKDTLNVSLTFLWIQGLISSLVSGHLALIPGLWVAGFLVLLNRYR